MVDHREALRLLVGRYVVVSIELEGEVEKLLELRMRVAAAPENVTRFNPEAVAMIYDTLAIGYCACEDCLASGDAEKRREALKQYLALAAAAIDISAAQPPTRVRASADHQEPS